MGTRTLLDRLDAALASCAAKLWSELLVAFALAGQCAGGVRCFPQMDGQATSADLPAGAATRGLPHAQGPAPKGAGRPRPCPVPLGGKGAAGDTHNNEPAQP